MSEFQEISTGFVPRNENPRLWVSQQNHIKGGYHQYNTLEELMNLHPDKMVKGMEVTINAHARTDGEYATKSLKLLFVPDVSFYPLVIPPNALDGGNNEIQPLDPNENFYLNFWQVTQELAINENTYAIEYAGDINGVKPQYPYINYPDDEVAWGAAYIAGTSLWYRERRSDATDGGTGIYLDWTVPRPLNGNFETGNYVQNLFIRAAVTPDLPGRYNKDGGVNNFPEGWSDIPTEGTDPLYEIKAQKDIYGNLKTDWIGPFLIPEDRDLVRYNSQSTPNPNTLSPTDEVATIGSPADIALVAAGWVKTFDPTIHNYRALRTENAPLDYSTWSIDKIAEESGEFIDTIYKLFSENIDFDELGFITANTPVGNNPIKNDNEVTANEGWSDGSLSEEPTLINCYSEARKFLDGSLKTVWSAPKPFTGRDVYADFISSGGQNTFKYPSSADEAAGTLSDPAAITLTANLYRGTTELTTDLTYKWFIVYNNKNIIAVDPGVDTPLATTKQIVIGPTDIATKAVYRCYVTLANVGEGDDLVFIEEEAITDITDGDDAKSLTVAADAPIIVYDTGESTFQIVSTLIRGRQNFLDAITFYWYKDDGAGNWVALTNGVDNYTLGNQTLAITNANLFASDGTGQTARFALSTADSINDVENVDEFFDIVTITKLASTSTGAAGADSNSIILSNEVDSIILDRATLLPQAGEITSSGRIKTLIKIYDGPTKLDYTTHWTITSLVSDTTDVTFGHQANGTDREIYIATWTSVIARKVNCTITIDIAGTEYVKNFTISSNLDDAGALISYIQLDSTSANQSLAFTPENRSDIKLEAILNQNGVIIDPSNFDGNVVWYFGSSTTSSNLTGTNKINKTVKRTDVVGSQAVSARIPYNGEVYITTPVSIDDITDTKTYRLHYNYADAYDIEANEPLHNETGNAPTKPDDLAVTAFETTFDNSGASSDWYKQAGSKTYFIVEGVVNNIAGVDTIEWQPPYRNRGETGSQGITPDFVVIYFKGSNSLTPPTIPVSANASRTEMLSDGWLITSNGISETYVYQAGTTFDGDNINILTAKANANWGVTRITAINGADSTVPGPSGTLQVGTTTTLAPGENATVNNSGTNEAAIFDFGIPEGEKGDDGVDGNTNAMTTFPDITSYTNDMAFNVSNRTIYSKSFRLIAEKSHVLVSASVGLKLTSGQAINDQYEVALYANGTLIDRAVYRIYDTFQYVSVSLSGMYAVPAGNSFYSYQIRCVQQKINVTAFGGTITIAQVRYN